MVVGGFRLCSAVLLLPVSLVEPVPSSLPGSNCMTEGGRGKEGGIDAGLRSIYGET